MSQEHAELAEQGVAAINEAYATQDIAPWRQQVEKVADPELLLEGSREAFTEGDWRGKEGAVAFVANQMEVLEEMWMRLDEFIDVDENRSSRGSHSGAGRGKPRSPSSCTRSMSSPCVADASCGGRSFGRAKRHSKPWAFQSRRCPRRTSTSCAGGATPGTAAISTPSPTRLTRTPSS